MGVPAQGLGSGPPEQPLCCWAASHPPDNAHGPLYALTTFVHSLTCPS